MFRIKEKYGRIIGIPALAIFLSFIFCHEAIPSLGMFLKSLAFVFIFWQGLFVIITVFRKKYPKIKQTTRRIIFSMITALSYILIADYILRWFFDTYFIELNWFVDSFGMHMLKNIFVSIMVAMVYELTYFYARWNQANIEAERLKTQQIVSQLESLKNQISPHFLFNSLNTLVAIIPENQDQAVRFTEKLSDVYRYILQYKDKELVDLKTELEFIKSYLFLLEIRYPENLNVEYRIASEALKTHIAPLTLQILVENVIKHNVISKSDPLTIEIYTDDENHVVVKNKLKLKRIAQNSTKTGLDNIRKRYQYLSDKSIEVMNNNQQFLVQVPLIHFESENKVAL
ncbi:MAG: histidine kinase [Flavobacteriales bacterium]|nr:histidine kinase [Flavobacteriales bacterium]